MIVQVTNKSVSLAIVIDYHGRDAYSYLTSYPMAVGINVDHVMGDGFIRTIGTYKNNSLTFKYSESLNTNQDPQFKEIRKVGLTLKNQTLSLTRTDSTDCELVKIN